MRYKLIYVIFLSVLLIGCAASTPEITPTSEPIQDDASSFKYLEFEGSKRRYLIFTPKSYTGTENLPLVIYLHSYGWRPKQGMDYTMLNKVANTYNFIVVYPGALKNWNSGIAENSQWPTRDVNDVGFIDALIDNLDSNYSIDLDRIYATGYSNGGFMAYKLACQLSHRIAAIASVGGVISTNTLADCNPLRPMPVLEIHGTKDGWVPISGLRGWESVDQTINYWTNFNNCVKTDTISLPDSNLTDNSSVEKIIYSNCTNNSNVIFFKVLDGGHTWPGAGPPGYSAGNTNQDINAGMEIWNFFKDYHLP